jgi:type I restriction enzyme S subunit
MSFPRYPAYKDSGVEWLGEVPEHWEVGQSRRRFALRNERALDGEEQLTASQKHGIIRQADFVESEGRRVVEVIKGADILKHVEAGDFVISMRSFQGGIEYSPCCGSISSAYVMLKPIKDVQPGFFRWLFMSDRYIQALQSTSNLVRDGQALRFSNFAQVDIPVFPLTEQASIAAFLDRETAKIDALIAEQQRLIELLQEKRQAVISHAVTKGLNPDAPMKDSGVEWLGEVPKHWEIKRIKHTSRMESGHTPDRKVEAYWVNCDIPWVSLNDTGFLKDNDYISETAHCINDLGIQNSSARLLPERVVVFSRDATIGRCAITTKQMAVSQHFIAWICGDEILAEYLLLRLKSMTHELERLTFGATLKTIGMPDVKTLVTPVPPINEQEEIVEHLQGETARLEGMSASVQQAVALLQERRSALISAAVTGQIDVRGLVAEVNAD